MNTLKRYVKTLFLVLLLITFAAGCRSSHNDGNGGGGPSNSAAPTVTFTSPGNVATGVAINAKINATFSEAMDPLTITDVTFTVKETVSNTAIAGTVSYSGVSALFTPASNLSVNTIYTVTVKGGVGGAANPAGLAVATDYVFGFATGAASDTTAPTVSGTIHNNGATNVHTNTKVGATFSEPMDPLTITDVTFTMKETVSNTAVAGTVNYSGVSAVFTPTNNLTGNTGYTITIKGGTNGAKDLAGNALTSDYVWSWTTGAAPDTTAPTVSGTIHTNGQTNVPINTQVGATFSEGMDPLTITNINFTLKETASNTAVAGTVSYSGVSAVFIPASNLASSTNYSVIVRSGTTGVKDLAGNAMAADFTISWTTAAAAVALDTTPPTVSGTIHTNGQTNVPVNTQVGATFSEGMDPLTITNINFTLKETASNTAVAGTVSYSGVSAVFIPASNLSSSTGYTVTIKGGANGVKDLAGNAMAADFTISWTTTASVVGDSTPPTVSGTINANGATNVPINTQVGATFSEGMDPLTITNVTFKLKETVSGTAVAGTVSYSGVSAVFTPASNLANSTGYTVTITTGVKDLAGNAMAADFTISWTTAAAAVALDTTAPTVSGTINANGATNVPVNTHVGATFSEGMDPLTITNVTFTLKETISNAAVAGTVSYSGVNAVFIPLTNLASSTGYTATVTTGAKDLAGNALASSYVWSWTTAAAAAALDTTPPTVRGTINADGATNVPVNTHVGATFSEGMDPLTITNVTFTLKETISNTAVAGTVSYSGVNAVFIPLTNLANSTSYTGTITTGAKDLAGNALASNYVWSWTTAAALDTTAPAVSSTIPLDVATGVATNGTVNATFSEAMDPLTITNVNFTLAGPSAAPVTGVVSYDALTKIATFTPAANLAASTSYYARISTGVKDLAGNALAADKSWMFTTAAAPAIGPAPVNLGTAGNYVILAETKISTTGTTAVTGNLGVSPAAESFITGFGLIADSTNVFSTSSLVTGQIFAANDAVPTPSNLTTAVGDMMIAYTDAAGRTTPDFTELYGGDISGKTLVPGLYKWGTGVLINSDVILSGGPNDVWIFQIAGDLTMGSGARVTLAGGALPKNIFWQVAGGTGVAFGTTAHFEGIVLAAKAITLNTGATVNGRLLSQTAVTLIANTIVQPAP